MQMNMVERTVGIEMSTNGIGVKCKKDNIVKFCWDKLKAGVWRSTTDWFPENQHIILDHDLRLAKGGPIVVIQRILCHVIYFGWVGYKVMDGAHFFIVWICFDPSIGRREPNSNCTIDKCLNCGCQHGKLVWWKQFTVGISKVHQMCVNLLE